MSLRTGLLNSITPIDQYEQAPGLDPSMPVDQRKQTSGFYVPRRHVFTVCGLCAVSIQTLATTVALVIVPICAEFKWSDATKGVVLSGFFYGYSIFCVVGGALAQRLNRPKLQIFSLLVASAILSATLPPATDALRPVRCFSANCDEVAMFLVQCLLGMAGACLNPAIHRLISVWSTLAERSRQHNFIYSGQQVGQVAVTVCLPASQCS